ncbi:MAG: hypothetical protein HY649_08035 [Acidobacteria bacterium]|nr:hypothetical protein [Acidobacteriota bacterium]
MRNFLVRAGMLAAALLVTMPLGVYAQKKTASALTVNIYDPVFDEQNTSDYYHNGTTYCSGTVFPTDYAEFTGDLAKPGSSDIYGFGTPWTLYSSGFNSTTYVHNADTGTRGTLRVQFDTNGKLLTLDTRGTALNGVPGAQPRKLTLDFGKPCTAGCGSGKPPGSTDPFGNGSSVLSEPILLNITLDFPYTSMEVCRSRACLEAQPAFAKLWFADPTNTSVTWRVDWTYLRVLRMSSDTWYILADSCDGGQIAGLSKLEGNRTRPRAVLNGYYLIPFFIEAKLKLVQ